MRFLLSLVAVLCLLSVPASAHYMTPPPAVVEVLPNAAEAGVGLFAGAVAFEATAVYLIGTNQDPVWHPLACWIWGDESRVGNEKTSACNYKDPQ